MAALIANARMYAVADGAERAWRALFAELGERAGLALEYVPHLYPEKLAELWARPDLGAAFVCGWPHIREGSVKQVLAAPVPAESWAAGQPLYRSVFVVRRDAAYTVLEDAFGSRLAYTIEDSHSGYNAPRRHLMSWRAGRSDPLFGEVLGPLVTPRRVVDAIAEGKADIGAVDSYCYALLMRHVPELSRSTRILAATEATLMPALMASPATSAETAAKLTAALLTFSPDKDSAWLEPLRISGFAKVDPAGYAITERWAREAAAAGIETIA